MLITEEAIDSLKELELISCVKSLRYLCKTKLNFLDVAEFHDDVFKILDSPSKKKLILLPRGHLKSSIVTVGNSIRDILRDANVRILIDNAIWDNSRKFLASIKEHFMSEKMQEIYPCSFTADTKEEMTISRRTMKHLKEPTIDTSGVEKTKTSQHYDVIYADDLVVRENVGTKEQIEKVILHYKDLLDLLEPNGKLVIIGTRWHYADLYGYLMETASKSFEVLRKASGWKDRKPIFPEKFTIEHLDSLREAKGNYEFSCQYENEPVDDESAHFRMSDARYYEELPKNITRFAAFDLAFSEREQADYTVGVVVATDDKKPFNIYVDFYKRGHVTPNVAIDWVYEVAGLEGMSFVGVEANSVQKVMYDFIMADSRRSTFPITALQPDMDKFRRVLKLQPFWENHRVFIRKEHTELLDELLRFPKGQHDDIIDALAYCVKIIMETAEAPRVVREGTMDEFEGLEIKLQQIKKDVEELTNG